MGNNPHALSEVGRADICSTDHERFNGVACCFQVIVHPVIASSSKSRYVFSDDPSWSALSDDAGVLGPQSAALAVDAGSPAGQADVLAGEAAADDVDGLHGVASNRSDVLVQRRVRPVLAEDGAREGLDLTLPGDGHACALEPKVEPADAAE